MRPLIWPLRYVSSLAHTDDEHSTVSVPREKPRSWVPAATCSPAARAQAA